MSRLPIRVRVAAAFAVAMAVVLAGIGLFLYARIGSDLSAAHDLQLRLRAEDLRALIRDPNDSLADPGGAPLIEQGESYAQLLDAEARVVDATRPLGDAPLLDREDLASARDGPIFRELPSVPGLDEPSRFLAIPVDRNQMFVFQVTTGKKIGGSEPRRAMASGAASPGTATISTSRVASSP